MFLHETREIVLTTTPDELRALADRLEAFAATLRLGDVAVLPEAFARADRGCTAVRFGLPGDYKAKSKGA